MIYIVVGVLFVIFLISLYLVKTYNGLVALRNKVRNQISQIDVELKRRFDLVPNLVETVKGYSKHEKTSLESVIEARNRYLAAANNTVHALEADNVLSGALTKLFALSESYPELKANTNFMSLQKELSNIEQKIAYSRQFYNDSVYKLNNKIEMFPSNIVAGIFGFNKESFFEVAESERANVTVSF